MAEADVAKVLWHSDSVTLIVTIFIYYKIQLSSELTYHWIMMETS
jgi:hypothetical protein